MQTSRVNSNDMDWFRTAFSRANADANGEPPAQLGLIRERAFLKFSEEGLPSGKNEDWKYTSLKSLARRDPLSAPKQKESDLARSSIEEALSFQIPENSIVFVDGRFAPQLSSALDGNKGFSCARILDLVAKDSEVETDWQNELLSNQEVEDSPIISTLNLALFTDGLYLRVPRDVRVDEPIWLIHFGSDAQEASAHTRNVLVLEEGSCASIVEAFIGERDARDYLRTSVTRARIGENAKLTHTKLVKESCGTTHLGILEADLSRASRLASHTITFGGELVRNEVHPRLLGPGAHADLFGITAIGGSQHVDNHTSIDHVSANCTSEEIFRGVYAGESRGVFGGTIFVRPGAQKTNAIQSNNNILLSDKAQVNTRPQLKIYADDVKCTHGATIGQLDDEALFYMRSRGIQEEMARRLLVEAFARTVTEKIEHDGLRDCAHTLLSNRLSELVASASAD